MPNDPKPNDPKPKDPKIIVDEDWKEQVEAEKEKLRHGQTADQPQEGPGTELPEASFSMLVTTLATQATMALGQSPVAEGQQPSVDLSLAKHLIDTLAMLEEKTKGNLQPDESGMLNSVLHQLRMLYVTIQSQITGRREQQDSSIELS